MATKNPSPFDNLKVSKENMRQSVDWFQSQIKIISRSSYQPKTLLGNTNYLVSNPTIGKMYLYKYNAKWKDQLPYWDALPIIIYMGKKEGRSTNFNGCNLHYLPPPMRLNLLKNLYDLANNDKFDATTRFKITYDILMRLSRAKNLGADFAFKEYIFDQMESKFLEIPPSSFPMVSLLPIENFQKQSKQYVWHQAKQRV